MDDVLLNFSPRFYATDSLFWSKLTCICTRSSVLAFSPPRVRFRISSGRRSNPRKEFVRRDFGANDHQFHRIHWMMPCLEVQKDQNSAQKTLLSNLGKDAKNNLGCRLMVGPVLLAHIYHTTLLHKASSYIFAAHCIIRT